MGNFNKHKSYQAVPNPAQPNKAQKPNSHNLNPIGSKYAKEYNKNSTKLLKQ